MLIVESTGRCIRNSTVAVLGNTNNRKKKMKKQCLTSDSLQGKARQSDAKISIPSSHRSSNAKNSRGG